MTRQERQEQTFNIFYEHLKKYKKEHKNCLVSFKYKTEDGYLLGQSVNQYRAAYKKHILNEGRKTSWVITKEQVKKLKIIGFIFDASEFRFYEFIEHLKKYKREHGDCLVPTKYKMNDGYLLGRKVDGYRMAYKKCILKQKSTAKWVITQEQAQLLKDIGFIFDVYELNFQIFVKYLKKYKKLYGNCIVPRSYKTEDDFHLGNRVATYRLAYKKQILAQNISTSNMITSRQVQILEDIGFKFILTSEEKRASRGYLVPEFCYIYGIWQISLKRWIYVGQTIDFNRRESEHFADSHKVSDRNKQLYLAMQEYGVDDFEMRLLEICKFLEADMREAYWTDKLQTIKKGYQVVAPKVIY